MFADLFDDPPVLASYFAMAWEDFNRVDVDNINEAVLSGRQRSCSVAAQTFLV